jgi:hypothetical protein
VKRLGLQAGLAFAALALGCGTRVIELEGADAGPDAGTIYCQAEKGPLGPCMMCYYPGGKPLGGDCQQTAVTPPACPANTGPVEGQCTRCQTFFPSTTQGKVNTCLSCKLWDKMSAVSVCRTCEWSGLPVAATCQQCMEPNGGSTDTCDETLKKLQLVF